MVSNVGTKCHQNLVIPFSSMLELVFANLRVRPFRTIISVIGVALGVVLVVMFTGLARGMTQDLAKRSSNWKAEIVFTRPGGMDTMSSNASVNMGYVPRLLEIEGVVGPDHAPAILVEHVLEWSGKIIGLAQGLVDVSVTQDLTANRFTPCLQ